MACILAIESSCDDTSAAVIKNGVILSNLISNQKIHEKYGGVVPELASRKHHEKIVTVVAEALKEASIDRSELNAIAFTQGPGLLGSLLVGCSFAKGLALSLDLPLIAVNHMEAHVLALLINDPKPSFPFLCLTVSGGHTEIVHVQKDLKMKILGSTRDDAAGEAFDKIGKYLGLKYPAGPEIDKLSQKGHPKFKFTKPDISDLDFSFSGLKTAVLYFLRDRLKDEPNFINDNLHDLCASVQGTIIEILMDKIVKAVSITGITEIAMAGGVSANSLMRKSLKDLGEINSWNSYYPQLQYCTDNAGMIAMAAHFKYEQKQFADQQITPDPRMKISRNP